MIIDGEIETVVGTLRNITVTLPNPTEPVILMIEVGEIPRFIALDYTEPNGWRLFSYFEITVFDFFRNSGDVSECISAENLIFW